MAKLILIVGGGTNPCIKKDPFVLFIPEELKNNSSMDIYWYLLSIMLKLPTFIVMLVSLLWSGISIGMNTSVYGCYHNEINHSYSSDGIRVSKILIDYQKSQTLKFLQTELKIMTNEVFIKNTIGTQDGCGTCGFVMFCKKKPLEGT